MNNHNTSKRIGNNIKTLVLSFLTLLPAWWNSLSEGEGVYLSVAGYACKSGCEDNPPLNCVNDASKTEWLFSFVCQAICEKLEKTYAFF